MHSLAFDFPIYYLLICLIIAFGYAFVLYRYEKNIRSLNIIRFLFFFRFMFIALISILLLNPKYDSEISFKEKPVVIIAKDNSESVKQDVTKKLKSLANLLNEYDVYFFSFSDDVYNDIDKEFDGLSTNYSIFFSSIKTQFENKNIAALILASDGCYNSGLNPEYITYDFPVYSIALGDTNFYEDIRIDNVLNNEVAFLGNNFPVEISLASNLLKKQHKKLIITLNEEIVFEKTIHFLVGNDYQTHNIYLPATDLGINSYSIKIQTLNEEKNILNNNYQLNVDVFDSKYKILILKENVSPDISAFKSAVSSVENNSIEIIDVSNTIDSSLLNQYDLIVLFGCEVIPNYVLNLTVPLMIFDVRKNHFNQLNSSITTNSISKVELVSADYNTNFSKFSISKNLVDLINNAPPLFTSNGLYKFSSKYDLFLIQKDNNLVSNKPIIFFQNINRKIAFVNANNWWKWKIYDYKKNKNNEAFNELFVKLTQFLVMSNNKSKFRIDYKSQLNQNEEVVFNAYLYNDVYELINSDDVSIQIFDEDDKRYEFQFSKNENSYSVNLGVLPVSKYNFIVNVKNSKFSKKGSFDILEVSREQIGPETNHETLYKISNLSSGNVFYPNEIDKINKAISIEAPQKIVYYKYEIHDLIDSKYLLFLILFIISFEWFLRKINGVI